MPSKNNNSFLNQMESGLQGLEARGQRRSLTELSGVNLCSNDYLGLAGHPALCEAVLRAVQAAPRVGGTGSRLLSGHVSGWDELEQEFADFVRSEAALYFGSGYAANIGLLSSVLAKDDLVFSDELNHASLIDGIRLSGARKIIYPHLDLNVLESELEKHRHERGRKFIVTETVFSMDGDVVDATNLFALAQRFGAEVILDEAHATGVHGRSGRGIGAEFCGHPNFLAATHTCGKALASAGAFVCGSRVLREHLVNHARTFIFSTAMPPYMVGQIGAALRLARQMDVQRAGLLARSRRLGAALREQGWDTAGSSTQIVPVVIGGNEEAVHAAQVLRDKGFAVRAIRPPTVKEGTARLRFSVTCAIAPESLVQLEESLGSLRAQHYAHASAGRA
jgi:8-amino-7-oxononanoate synthase